MGNTSPDSIDFDNPPFPLTDVDRELLSMKDDDFRYITWEDLKDIIGEYSNALTFPLKYSGQTLASRL